VTASNVPRSSVHRLDEVRNQVVAALQLHVDVRPPGVDLVAQPDDAVVEHPEKDEQENDDRDEDVDSGHSLTISASYDDGAR